MDETKVKRIHWDKWGFIPALVLSIATILLWLFMMQTPRWPLHFNADGVANCYGDILALWSLIVLQAIVIIIMGALDEQIYRYGSRRWNIAGAIAAFLAGMGMALLVSIYLAAQAEPVRVPGGLLFRVFGSGIAGALVAYILEQFRTYPGPAKVSVAETVPPPEFSGKDWTCREHVSSAWIDFMLFGAGLLFALGSIVVLLEDFYLWPVSAFIAVFALICLIASRGFFVTLTPERLLVRLGIFRIPVLNLRTADIIAAEATEFNAISCFGGWGINYTPWGGWGFVTGRRGVEIRTRKGRRITLSSEHGAELAAILKQVI